MKRILLAAGVGLGLLTATMAASSGNHALRGNNNIYSYGEDTVPKKDTSKPKKPHPDSTKAIESFIPNR